MKDMPLCPSAQPDMADSVVFGIVGGTAKQPRVGYLAEPQPTTSELLKLTRSVEPTEVFRFAARCASNACRHYDGSKCRLAARAVQKLDAVVDSLPQCRLRPTCRWWQQEGKAACVRCPQIVTTVYAASDLLKAVAEPIDEDSQYDGTRAMPIG